MTSNTPEQHKNFFFSFLQNISPFGKTRTHNFCTYQEDADYSVDFADSYNSAHLITGISVREGDYIILTDREQILQYYAETVDRYSISNSLREIRLKRILLQTQK